MMLGELFCLVIPIMEMEYFVPTGVNSPDRRDGNYAYYIHPEGDIRMSYVNGYGISYGIYSYPYKGIFSF